MILVAAVAAVVRCTAADEAEKRMKNALEAAMEQGPLTKKMEEMLESFGNLQTGAVTTGGFATKGDVSEIVKEEFKLANFATKDDLAKFATKDDVSEIVREELVPLNGRMTNLDTTFTKIYSEYQKGQEAAGEHVAGFFRGVFGPFFAAVFRAFRNLKNGETCDS